LTLCGLNRGLNMLLHILCNNRDNNNNNNNTFIPHIAVQPFEI
jgi:hypothetical protein